MGKQKAASQTTSTYNYAPPVQSADIDALRTMKASTNPSIPFEYAKRREMVDNEWSNPFGAAGSPAAQAAARRVTNNSLAQDEAQATAESQYNADQQNYARASGVAELTRPQLVQTAGTNNSQQWGSGLYSPLGQFGLNTLSAGLGGGA